MSRKSIKLQPHDDHLLRQEYLNLKTPSDQWAQLPHMLVQLVTAWNLLTGNNHSVEDVRHYVVNKRKCGRWVRFDGDYNPLRSPGEEDFTPAQWTALRTIWIEMNKGREQFAFDADLRQQLAERFRARTGQYVPGEQLYAAAMARQKRGDWPHVRDDDIGFGDIDQVGG